MARGLSTSRNQHEQRQLMSALTGITLNSKPYETISKDFFELQDLPSADFTSHPYCE